MSSDDFPATKLVSSLAADAIVAFAIVLAVASADELVAIVVAVFLAVIAGGTTGFSVVGQRFSRRA